ncbi:flagellar export chaperone FlgN [Oscillibacter sp.]|uniref:flagellar export chaperone FlgN n=1 Tax=Oscillibacter sp. TaxID=1945593 RepID=UPI0028AB6055|nr:flagellar export chaperone FlgN [Oscillibacter sp.]
MDRNDFREYLGFLKALGDTLEDITRVEQEKTEFVRTDDLDGLNECMKREQALSLAMRAHDQKRETMLRTLGLEGVPLRSLMDYASAQDYEETKRTVEQLCRQYALFRGAFEVARDTLECNLHQIEKMIQAEDPDAASSAGYPEASPELPPRMRTDFRA